MPFTEEKIHIYNPSIKSISLCNTYRIDGDLRCWTMEPFKYNGKS